MKYLHTMVRVHDLDASLGFYCDLLGLVETDRYESDEGQFTLVFLAAPEDLEQARAARAPLVELTYNWDGEEYQGGRNFGHLAYAVDDVYADCQKMMDAGITINVVRGLPENDGCRNHDQRSAPRWAHGVFSFPRQYFNRAAAKG